MRCLGGFPEREAASLVACSSCSRHGDGSRRLSAVEVERLRRQGCQLGTAEPRRHGREVEIVPVDPAQFPVLRRAVAGGVEDGGQLIGGECLPIVPAVGADVPARQVRQRAVSRSPIVYKPAEELLDRGEVEVRRLDATASAEQLLESIDSGEGEAPCRPVALGVEAVPAHQSGDGGRFYSEDSGSCILGELGQTGGQFDQATHRLAQFGDNLLNAGPTDVVHENKTGGVKDVAGAGDDLPDVFRRGSLCAERGFPLGEMIGEGPLAVCFKRI